MLLTTDTNMRIVARGKGLKAEFYPFGFDYEEAERRKVSFISTSDEVESVPVSRKSSDIERSYGADRQDFLKLIVDTIKRRSSFKRSLKFGGDDKFEDPLKFHTACAIWRRRDEDI